MTPGGDRIDASTLWARIESGSAPAILDVRSRFEFARGHVPGATHVPFWRLSRRVDEIASPRGAELVVYCGHGPRAIAAGALLRRRGFTRIVYLEGHYSQWRSTGFREERD
jgi:rhodanese-related sulfurtransferase